MQIVIAGSAFRHGISAHEIRAVVEFPQFSYEIESRIDPGAQVYLLVGGPDNEASIEVIVELVDSSTWVAFHAMLLTRRTAREIEELFGGAVKFEAVGTQRPSREERSEDVRKEEGGGARGGAG